MVPRRIIAEEWERIPIGVGDEELRSGEVIELNTRWQALTGLPVERFFDLRYDAITPKGWSGTLALNEVVLSVVPKGAGRLSGERRHHLDTNIAEMMSVALSGGEQLDSRSHRSFGGASADNLIASFLDHLGLARRRAVVRSYATRILRANSPSGRLLFPAQAIESITRPSRFITEETFLSENNPTNRYFKAALTIALSRAAGLVRARIEKTLVEFDQVETPQEPSRERARIVEGRLAKEYKYALRLADAILDRQATGLFAGLAESPSHVVFTAALFERYIGVLVERLATAAGLECHLQPSGYYMGAWLHAPSLGLFETTPDVVLRRSLARPTKLLVMDTKWKRLTAGGQHGIDIADLYQMSAYASVFGAREVVMLFPWIGDAPPFTAASKSFAVSGGPIVHVALLPLGEVNLIPVENRLRELISAAFSPSEVHAQS